MALTSIPGNLRYSDASEAPPGLVHQGWRVHLRVRHHLLHPVHLRAEVFRSGRGSLHLRVHRRIRTGNERSRLPKISKRAQLLKARLRIES